MFKSVEYAGFADEPDLKAKAEQAVAALAGIVRDRAAQIELELEASPNYPRGVEVAVTLDLPAASGRASRFLPEAELTDPDLLESRCRLIWDRAMGAYLEQRKPAWDEILKQPAEV